MTARSEVIMKVRVMHYMNQFFAGVGGEDKAGVPLDYLEGAVGPGKRLQDLFKDSAEIVVTAYCGDNYFSEHMSEVLEKVLQIARDQEVEIVVAGPAFQAGRYGFACSEVCHFLSTSAGLYCVTAMNVENPGVDGYRQYKDRRVFLFPTTEVVAGMEDALTKMAGCVSKLATDSTMGPAAEEGYIPRGIRIEETVSKSSAERAIDMLLDKVAGRPFTTETPLEFLEEPAIAPRITNLKDVHLALVTTSGVVPEGNPDKLKASHNTEFGKYSIDKLDSMKDSRWDVIHYGYVTGQMHDNPNYGVPLDVCRELEREGAFARLYPYFYSSPGVGGTVSDMRAIGRRIALDMNAAGMNAAIMVPT